MDYQEFQKQVAEKICDYLPEEFRGAMIGVHNIQKNNGVIWDALVIRHPGDNAAPNIYLNGYYLRHQMGTPMEDILHEIAAARKELQKYGQVDIDTLTDFEQIKEQITFRVVGVENNQEMLSALPHRIEQDMALIYQVLLEKSEEGIEFFTVTNKMMEYMGISETTLHELAVNNTPREFPVKYHSINDIAKEVALQEMMQDLGEDYMDEDFAGFINEILEDTSGQIAGPDIPLYVLTNESLYHGAAALFYPGVKEMLAEEVGSNYFVLPSSVHEVMIVPDNGMLNHQALREMVNDINQEVVRDLDILTGEVYYYDRKEKKLSIAGAKKEREAEKIDVSIADKLSSKQKNAKINEGNRKKAYHEITI